MATQRQTPHLAEIKARQQQVWSMGDFARIGNSLVIMGEMLCEATELHAGQKVLDVATGGGNTAISAARRNCRVTGMDYVPELISYARKRAGVEQMDIVFEVGDAEDLRYPDEEFDTVLSTVGVMFAPDQEKAASELLRVCRPKGKIGLANWTPDGYVGNMLRTISKHVPPPPGVRPPPQWGTQQRLQELLGSGISSLEIQHRTYTFCYESPKHFVRHFREYFGPIRKAFETLDEAGGEALAADLEELLENHNTAQDSTLAVPAEYLEVIATKS